MLIKIFGLPFYKQHAGLFVVFIYLFFGMIQGYDLIYFHIALLISICSSMLNLALLFLFWMLYSLKCFHFVKEKLKLSEYRFANNLTILPKVKQLKIWLKLYAFLLIPILAYAIVVVATAIKHQYYLSAFAVVMALFAIFGLLTFFTFKLTNYIFLAKKQWFSLPKTNTNKPFWLWPIFYLLKEQAFVFLICKIVSLLFFKAILWVFTDVGDDVRVYLTAILAVVLSHSVLMLNLVKFDASYLSFAKHLPISAAKRLIDWVLICAILLIPEFTLLIVLTPFSISSLGYCILLAISAMLFLKMLVYYLKAAGESYLKCLLFFFFATMLAILANYYLIFSVAMFISSATVYLWKYNQLDLKELV